MERHQTALRIAAAALVLGVAADTLLRYEPWGVNALLWTGLFVGAAFFCTRGRWALGVRGDAADETRAASPDTPNAQSPAPAERSSAISLFPALAALAAATGLVWRDSEFLTALDILLLLLFLPMLALRARGVALPAAGLAQIVGAQIVTGLQTVAGFPQLVFSDLSWNRPRTRGGMRPVGVAVRGTLLAAPMLVVFGALLSSADERFERLLRDLFVFDLDELFLHLLVTGIVAAICAGFLRSLALSGPMPELGILKSAPLNLPAAETNFALALVNVMFAAFVALQFRYFFGRTPAVLAEHARRGFFELVWVVTLVLPMLLLLDWLVVEKKVFRILACIQIALVSVIAGSAWMRMAAYRDEFGLTEERLYATAFMIVIAILLVWLAATVLTGRRERFAMGALAIGVASVFVLHAINPDALIARTNLARAGQRPFDDMYVARLSADAAPVIAANVSRFSGEALWRYAQRQPRTIGWRTWNVSRARGIELRPAYESKATPPMRPVRAPGSGRESSSSRKLETSRNR